MNLTKVNTQLWIPQTSLIWIYPKHEPSIQALQIPIEALNQRNPPVYNFKTTLENLDLALLMTGLQQLQIYWFW